MMEPLITFFGCIYRCVGWLLWKYQEQILDMFTLVQVSVAELQKIMASLGMAPFYWKLTLLSIINIV